MYSSNILLFVAALFSVSSLAAPVAVPGTALDLVQRDTIAAFPVLKREANPEPGRGGSPFKREAEDDLDNEDTNFKRSAEPQFANLGNDFDNR